MITNKNTNTKYNISQLMYPDNLLDPVYGGNMVVFFINVAKASKFIPNGQNQTIDMSQLDTPSLRGLTIARNVSGTNAAISGVASGLGVAALASVLGGWQDVKKAVGLAGVASGVSLAAAFEIAGTTTREQKRLTSAIALHMPNDLSIRYSVGWESEDMSGAEMASMSMQGAGESLMKSRSELNPSGMISSVAAAVANLGLSKGAGGSYASVRSGLAPNPRKEMVFKGVDFRRFSFTYQFFPRSEAEAQNVQEIIRVFKFHMHPEYKDTNSFLYLYPSEFDISYQTKSGENTHIHKHTSCVLTDMNINYTPQNNFNAFSNGMPTQINITLEFKELAIPTKETIDKGL
jgi:hypothetical protein